MSHPKAAAPSAVLATAERDRLLAAPDVGMLSLDADGRIVDVNPFLSDLLLYSGQELRGKGLWEISTSSPTAAALHAMQQLYRSGHLRHAELPLSSKDGVRIHFEFRHLGRLPDDGALLECRFHELVINGAHRDPEDEPVTARRLVVVDAERLEVAANRELARTREHGAPLSLLSVGVDRSGAADASGQAPSPQLLRGFAAACARELRATDLVGKVDPSAFVVLMPDTSASGARSAAERLRTAVASMQWPAARRRVTLSIGTVTTRTGKSAYRALRSRVDAKREDARSSGGNRVNA
jgi:diguanylate cyclase (GGDEF)-like protein/PAS domain S-box-containing protein